MKNRQQTATKRRWSLILTGTGLTCAAMAWQAGWAQEPIGWMYSHPQDSFPANHLGDVPEVRNLPRSLADDRVRQFDELDRPRIAERTTNRGAQVNEERFSVYAATNEDDARWAAEQFGLAWDEFGKLASTFTDDHLNPDFGIGQLLIVIDNEPLHKRNLPLQTLITENGQTIVYLNVSEGQPALRDQLPRLQQGAAQALLHLAELDRKFPTWAQQGLAEYNSYKLAQAATQDQLARTAEDEAGLEPEDMAEEEVAEEVGDALEEHDAEDAEQVAENQRLHQQPAFAGMNLAGGEYWRLQRVAPDRLAELDEEEEPNTVESLERVKFLMEGEDGKYAPSFLLALRYLAEEATDRPIESRRFLTHTQLLPPPEETVLDELLFELEPQLRQWQIDPQLGLPVQSADAPKHNATIEEAKRAMEVVLKLAQRVAMPDPGENTLQPRVVEFGVNGAREIVTGQVQQQAIDVQTLYAELTSDDMEPWATIDADGRLLLWTNTAGLEEALGLETGRYRSLWRDGHWVLVTTVDDNTQIEAWLEDNPDNPNRPLLKFTLPTQPAPTNVVAPSN